MKFYLVWGLAVLALILAGIPGTAANENYDNEWLQELLENILDLRENYVAFKVGITGDIESLDNELRGLMENRFDNFEEEILAIFSVMNENSENFSTWLISEFQALSKNITENFENLRVTMTTESEERLDRFENRLCRIVEDIDVIISHQNSLEAQLAAERENKTDLAGLGVAIMDMVLIFGIIYGLRSGTFSKTFPESAKTPKQKIITAIGLLDHRLETEAPPEEIEAAKIRFKTLKDLYPGEFKQLDLEKLRIGEKTIEVIKPPQQEGE